MKSKTKYTISAILVIISLVMAASAVAAGSAKPYNSTGGMETATPIISQAAEGRAVEDGFVLRELDGYIAIYSSAFDKRPTTVTNIEVANLRKVDRELLAQGIVANTQEELMLLLEDLGS